jgi:hypothetical protein
MEDVYKKTIALGPSILPEDHGWDPNVHFFLYEGEELHMMKLSTLAAKIKELKKEVMTNTHLN